MFEGSEFIEGVMMILDVILCFLNWVLVFLGSMVFEFGVDVFLLICFCFVDRLVFSWFCIVYVIVF